MPSPIRVSPLLNSTGVECLQNPHSQTTKVTAGPDLRLAVGHAPHVGRSHCVHEGVRPDASAFGSELRPLTLSLGRVGL